MSTLPMNTMKLGQSAKSSTARTVPLAVPTAKKMTSAFARRRDSDSKYTSFLLSPMNSAAETMTESEMLSVTISMCAPSV